MDLGGDFDVVEFKIGKHKTEPSRAKIVVKARDGYALDAILLELHALGVYTPKVEDAEIAVAMKDKAPPEGFYCTTHHPTHIRLGKRWIPVEDAMMDSVIVVRGRQARCVKLGAVRKGDRIVVGQRGVRVEPPERPRAKTLFEFMSSRASSEKPSASLIAQIARELRELRSRGAKVAVVAGPAVVHTGGAPALAELIRGGYVHTLLSGNALAAHDIEYALYGTSLGMDLANGTTVHGGHRHHLYAIADVLRAGGIAQAVKAGSLTSGIMYECVQHKVPFVLAGSIRDDGPLPDVITDVVEAQERYIEALQGIDLVLMLGTMLHSIAVGNLIPSTVRTVCVDIDASVVTKLMDRGTAQAIGIVTDVGTFLPMLAQELRRLEAAPETKPRRPRAAAAS